MRRLFWIVRTIVIAATWRTALGGMSESVRPGSCPAIDNRETRLLNNCRYEEPTVTCSMLFRVTNRNTSNAVDLKRYFSLEMRFRTADKWHGENNNNGSTAREQNVTTDRCLTLAEAQIAKNNDEELDDSGSVQVYVHLLFFSVFTSFDLILVEATFSSSEPVASYHLHEDCSKGKKLPCTASVRMLKEISLINDEDVAFHDDAFWTHLRRVFSDRLKSRIRLLNLIYSENSKVNPSYYLPNLGGFSLEGLRIVGADWPVVQRETFPHLPDLKQLQISRSHVNTIAEDLFDSTPNVEYLSLSANSLTQLPGSITSLKKLESLNISNNPSLDMNNTAEKLTSFTNLHWLDLSEIPFKYLVLLKPFLYSSNDLVGTSKKLQGLYLRHCDLDVLKDDDVIFEKLTSLTTLDLSRNHLSEIPFKMFRSMNSLQTLNLASNSLAKSMKLEIGNYTRVKFIDLSKNKISNLEDVFIPGGVDNLDVSDNYVTEWKNDTLFRKEINQKETWVNNLNLSQNAITFVSKNMTTSLSELDSVDLGGNEFDCDHESVPAFQSWLRQKKRTVVYNFGTTSYLRCAGPIDKSAFVVDVNFTSPLRLKEGDNIDYIFVVGVPLVLVLALALLSVVGMYGYRFEIAYVKHLINIRRQRYIRDNSSIDYKYDAFVSYSAVDRDWVVHQLQPHLEDGAEKYRLCLHERDFVLGSIIADNIVECMKNSRNTLVILTPHFVKSQWCRWELEVANHKLFEDDREFLILVELKKLDKKKLPQHLSYLLDTRTYLEWPEGPGLHPAVWKRLKYAMGDSLYQRRTKAQLPEEQTELNSDEEDVVL